MIPLRLNKRYGLKILTQANLQNLKPGEKAVWHRPISSRIFWARSGHVFKDPLAQPDKCGKWANFFVKAVISTPALLRKILHQRAIIVGSTCISSASSSMVCVLKQMPTIAASLITSNTLAYGIMKHGNKACDFLQFPQYTLCIGEGPNKYGVLRG